jgi:hypothetical protein
VPKPFAGLPRATLFWRPQPIFATKAFSGCDHVLTIEDFQQGRYGFLGVTRASLDVLRKNQLGFAHDIDDQFTVGNAGYIWDTHVITVLGRLPAISLR